MNKVIHKAKESITSQKKKYLFLSTILLIGIISGIAFIFFISKEDKSLVESELTTFFSYIKEGKWNYFSAFIHSILANSTYLLFIWILGISIIGIPVVLFLLFLKGFIFGFSCSSIVYHYGLKGIFLAISYQIPHNLLLLIVFLLISFYAINFSTRLFKMLFLKEDIHLPYYFKRYNKISVFCFLIILMCTILETFLSPILMNLFL